MAWRRIERDKVDDPNGDVAADIGRERSSNRDLDRIGDFEMSPSRDAESVGLQGERRNSNQLSRFPLHYGLRDRIAHRYLKRV